MVNSIAIQSPRHICLIHFFHIMFSRNQNGVTPHANQINDPNLSTLTIDKSDVEKILNSLDLSKAIGPDGIPRFILKHFSEVLSDPICRLFNDSLLTSMVPSEWKRANIILVFKKGDPMQVFSQLPADITFTNNFSGLRAVHIQQTYSTY